MARLIPVILCGGSGTRLWPLSRASKPKQFVEFEGEKTLFQHTVERANDLLEAKNPIVVSNKSHIHLVRKNLEDIGVSATLVMEPEAKNTAPAIALAALVALKHDPDAIVLVLPSDHVIKGASHFQKAVSNAISLAQSNFLVTFGITPSGPETGFGYIQQGESLGGAGYRVKRFIEKPCREHAEEMLAAGGFHWNSGMFVFRAQTFIDELKVHAKAIYDSISDALPQFNSQNVETLASTVIPQAEIFRNCPADSIDYAVMEKTEKAAVIPLSIEWNDMGAWSAFYQLGKKDDKSNVIRGDVIATSTEGCYINSTNRLIATVGLKDLVIVETKDAVFVAPMSRVQEAKKIVGQLQFDKRTEAELPPVVGRPWGSYESLARGTHYQTKRIIVHPGEQLSLQLHHHRSEHWTVVEGYPDITVGKETRTYSPNESVYIPKECVHRLTNRSDYPVTIIEVQCGDYLGEDDIVRLEDKYSRS